MKWITALDLQKWADTLQARAILPELVGDLIRASASELQSFRFLSGDKSQVRGFDGRLSAIGAPPFVPDGDSIWEFGVAPKPHKKAGSVLILLQSIKFIVKMSSEQSTFRGDQNRTGTSDVQLVLVSM